jgi:hypothetical protein
MAGELNDIGPVSLEPVIGKEAAGLWNEYIERYHYLGMSSGCGMRRRGVHHYTTTPKAIYVQPLCKDFRLYPGGGGN